jgi:nucleotide-binding universal stress UspA family protein
MVAASEKNASTWLRFNCCLTIILSSFRADAREPGKPTWQCRERLSCSPDRLPLILVPRDYGRWLSDEPAPRDLMRPFPAEPMRMWRISTRVNKPENDDPSLVEPIALSKSAA